VQNPSRKRLGAFLALLAVSALAGCGSASPQHSGTSLSGAASSTSDTSSAPTTSDSAATPSVPPAATTAAVPAAAPPASVIPTPATSAATAATTALPLSYSTGSATQVITVVAASTSSTTAVLQAWDKTATGWATHGPSVVAHVGSAGLRVQTSEGLSATPIGSFTLTQAFGADANPGTALPYHLTTPADWWISQPGSRYNTMQTCSGTCPFTQGDPNEHLHSEVPFYNYAVVIDYNVSPVVQGAGSAFFLHVNPDGKPTAGCVSIPQANLITIMKWLSPAAQPRILIGIR
jgi:L,D-peptidoglycan transpeptidase YkuD (ErfK/YbiS/YcfS/YnhG family)